MSSIPTHNVRLQPIQHTLVTHAEDKSPLYCTQTLAATAAPSTAKPHVPRPQQAWEARGRVNGGVAVLPRSKGERQLQMKQLQPCAQAMMSSIAFGKHTQREEEEERLLQDHKQLKPIFGASTPHHPALRPFAGGTNGWIKMGLSLATWIDSSASRRSNSQLSTGALPKKKQTICSVPSAPPSHLLFVACGQGCITGQYL